MKKIKEGDTILVPFKVLNIYESGDYSYILGYDTMRLHADAEMLERFQQAAGGEDSGKTYEDGMRDAWKTARRIAYYDIDDPDTITNENLKEIFGTDDEKTIFIGYTAQQAAAKIVEWEAGKNIQVKDQVRYGDTDLLGVAMEVIKYDRSHKRYRIWWDNGNSSTESECDIIKTGRTIDIAGMLAQIGWVDNE